MARDTLYMEQRIAVVRKALNEKTLDFQEHMSPEWRGKFKMFVLDCMEVLDFGTKETAKRLTDESI